MPRGIRSPVEPNGWPVTAARRGSGAVRRRDKRGGTATVLDRAAGVLARASVPARSERVPPYPRRPRRRPLTRLPRRRAGGPRLLEAGRHLPGVDRPARGRARVGLLRRTAVRQRPPALRAPPHGLREGPVPALPDHARPPGAPALRLGHARTPGRARGRAPARHHRQERDRGDGDRGLQPGRPRRRAALHRGVAGLRHPPGALGRLRARLQDARPHLHGVGDLGVQDPARQGARLRGLPRAAVLLARPDAAVEP